MLGGIWQDLHRPGWVETARRHSPGGLGLGDPAHRGGDAQAVGPGGTTPALPHCACAGPGPPGLPRACGAGASHRAGVHRRPGPNETNERAAAPRPETRPSSPASRFQFSCSNQLCRGAPAPQLPFVHAHSAATPLPPAQPSPRPGTSGGE